LHGKDG